MKKTFVWIMAAGFALALGSQRARAEDPQAPATGVAAEPEGKRAPPNDKTPEKPKPKPKLKPKQQPPVRGTEAHADEKRGTVPAPLEVGTTQEGANQPPVGTHAAPQAPVGSRREPPPVGKRAADVEPVGETTRPIDPKGRVVGRRVQEPFGHKRNPDSKKKQPELEYGDPPVK